MAAPTSNSDSKIYVAIEGASKDQLMNKDFQYPLLLTYHVFTTDRSTNKDILIYERSISIQKGGLDTGLQLHLLKLNKISDGYRLSADAVDKGDMKFTSIASIALLTTGTIKEKNPRHLNTIILQIKD